MLQEWEAVSIDCRLSCATSIVDSERDFSRLKRSVTSRGLGTFVLDLPTLDDLLLSLLENGSVRFSGPFTARKSRTDRRPRFLWSFWSLVCDASGCLLSEPCPNAIVAIRMMACLHKKLSITCSPDRVSNTMREFHEIEEQIVAPSLSWSSDDIDVTDVPSFPRNFGDVRPSSSEGYRWNQFLQRLEKVSAILVSSLPLFDAMSDNNSTDKGYFRHGRGAVSNRRRNEYKYLFPNWSDKLERVFPFDWCSGEPIGTLHLNRVEVPASLSAVPKTAKGPRLIASEPVEHQWCQQKIFTWLDYHIKVGLIGRFVALHDQGLSQKMVAQASIDQSFCTIDLSSASDRISCRHIESLFRSNPPLIEAFHAVRSRFWTDKVENSGTFSTKKFTTMGSALTFPVQCIFFLAVTLASAGAHDLASIRRLVGKVRVFGDDIIAPNHAYEEITSNLTRLGLKVNLRKSFHKGKFRESCGADYWNGFDVTPVKPKVASPLTPEDYVAILDTSNNLYKKGYWRASEFYASLLPSRMKSNVYDAASGVPGLISYCGTLVQSVRWCKNLHYSYTMQLCLKSKVKKVALDSSAMLCEFFTREFNRFNPRTLGIAKQTKARLALVRVPV